MSVATETQPKTLSDNLKITLTDRIPLGWRNVVLCGAFAVFFIYLSYIPLFHSDIWCHAHYGQWILEHGSLPAQDPFMPLAEGMRVVDNAWLSQVIFAQVEIWRGPAAMSSLFAIVVFATYLIYARIFYLLSGRPIVVLGGLFVLFFVGFSRHAIIRPEIFGGLCFALLLWMLVRIEPWRSRALGFKSNVPAKQSWPWWLWIATPLLFLFWANAHGSFAVGLVVLGCHAAGRMIEAAWRARNPLAVFTDSECRRWILLLELALAATLINPYGLDLLIETARFGSNPNLRDVLEWYPLKLIDLEGIQFCLALGLLMVLLRHSRQRMRPADVLLLLVFGAAVAPTIRMIGWFAPVFAFVMMPHIADIWSRLFPKKKTTAVSIDPERQHFLRLAATLSCLLLIWCGFALSAVSQPVLGGTPRAKQNLFSRDTPHGITQYLHEHPPEGLVFGPQWWGDWLSWDGPSGIQVFMTTNLHLAPRRVWRDYLTVARGQSGWERILDKYDVQTLIVHKELQAPLVRAVRRSAIWKKVYEDAQGIILQRA